MIVNIGDFLLKTHEKFCYFKGRQIAMHAIASSSGFTYGIDCLASMPKKTTLINITKIEPWAKKIMIWCAAICAVAPNKPKSLGKHDWKIWWILLLIILQKKTENNYSLSRSSKISGTWLDWVDLQKSGGIFYLADEKRTTLFVGVNRFLWQGVNRGFFLVWFAMSLTPPWQFADDNSACIKEKTHLWAQKYRPGMGANFARVGKSIDYCLVGIKRYRQTREFQLEI